MSNGRIQLRNSKSIATFNALASEMRNEVSGGDLFLMSPDHFLFKG
jgi:hypothetical protein